MRPIAFIAALIVLPWVAWADAVDSGWTEAAVRASLGRPHGQISGQAGAVWLYPQGTVTFSEGKVVAHTLRTPEELEALEDAREARAAAAEAEARERRERGEALRDQTLADPAFLRSSAAEQVAFWRRFRQHYPEVDISEPYRIALAERSTELAEEQAAAAREAEVRRLEAQVADAERRAQEAEARRREAEASRSWSGAAVVVVHPHRVPHRVVRHRPGPRQPPPATVAAHSDRLSVRISSRPAVNRSFPPTLATDLLDAERTQGPARTFDTVGGHRSSLHSGGFSGHVHLSR